MVFRARACERNWSAYEFVHSKKRNRSTPERENDLVYVFTQKKLGKRFVSRIDKGPELTREEREMRGKYMRGATVKYAPIEYIAQTRGECTRTT